MAEATRLVDVCLDAGLTMFDSADIYSSGLAEEILGQAIKGRRDKVIISTKGTFRIGPGTQRRRLVSLPPDCGPSRPVCGGWAPTDIDLYQLHGFDALTPSRRCWARSTTWCAPARSATSAARTSPAGT